MGTTRFDLDSALALNPIRGECLFVGFSPYPNKGTLSLFPLAEETLARNQAGL